MTTQGGSETEEGDGEKKKDRAVGLVCFGVWAQSVWASGGRVSFLTL